MHGITTSRFIPSRSSVSCSIQVDVRLVQNVCGYRQSDPVHAFRCRQNYSPKEWCSVKVMKALEKGYRIVQLHEVWHFPQKTDTLFKEYIDTFTKIKLEASGYPKNCVTDEQKQWYVNDSIELSTSVSGIIFVSTRHHIKSKIKRSSYRVLFDNQALTIFSPRHVCTTNTCSN